MSQFAARAGQKGAKVAKLAMFTATDVEISLMLFAPPASSISLFAVVAKQIIGVYNKKLIIKLNND